MNQIGDTLHLTATFDGLPAGVPVTYIWEFPWDNSVAATTVPAFDKVLNKGGNPANGQLLYYTVTAALPDGQHISTTQSVAVNWPPMIVPSPTISKNDATFPYDTQIAFTAWDVEQAGALSFLYTQNGTVLGHGVQTPAGQFSGTYDGTVVSVYGTHSAFARTVQSSQVVQAVIVDSQSGTRTMDFHLSGRFPAAPGLSLSASVPAVSSEVGRQNPRIGPGQIAQFAVYVSDAQDAPFDFLWTFAGSHGWATTAYSAGTTGLAPGGAIRNTVDKSLEGETGGVKTVTARVHSQVSGLSSIEQTTITLVDNTAASSAAIHVFDGILEKIDGDTVNAGTKVKFTAVAVDPQDDLSDYRWEFAQPSPVSPSTLVLYGAEALLDTTDYPAGATVQGTLHVTDRLGASASFPISPVLRITSPP